MSDRFKTCSQCPREMNVMDEHENCFRHRDCNEGSPCDICKDWTPERWSSIRKMVEKAIARANKPATITSPPPESRSEETRADVQVSFMGKRGHASIATPTTSSLYGEYEKHWCDCNSYASPSPGGTTNADAASDVPLWVHARAVI